MTLPRFRASVAAARRRVRAAYVVESVGGRRRRASVAAVQRRVGSGEVVELVGVRRPCAPSAPRGRGRPAGPRPSVFPASRSRLPNTACLGAALAVLGALAVPAVAGQPQRWSSDPYEGRALREASALEAQGDLAGAEARLRELAERRPESTAAVFALERVLRRSGRLDALAPLLTAHLDANPAAVSVRSLQLRVLRDADSPAAIDAAVRRWIRADPGAARPYREGARAFVEAGDLPAAARLLAAGVGALGSPPALLLASGDVHAAMGRFDEVARAWAAAMSADRAAAAEVFVRLDRLETGRDAVVRGMLAIHGSAPLRPSSLEMGAELALREGRQEDARALVDQGLRAMDPMEARGFLRTFARRAEDLEFHASAVWAYERLRETAPSAADARRSDERLAVAAAAAGDTGAAIAAMRRVRDAHPRGSPERRDAWIAEVRMRLAAEGPEVGSAAFAEFRREFPDDDEVGGLAAAVAAALIENGEREAALRTLDGIAGPGARLERAYLLLEAGAVPEGAQALRDALPDLAPAEATGVLDVVMTVTRLTTRTARAAARVAVLGRRGRPEDAVRAARAAVGEAAPDERAPLLALAARVADGGGLAQAAEELRRRIVADHPDSDEFPEAAVRLAKAIAGRPDGVADAMRILESVIVARPGSAVVPEARRELNRLRVGGGSGAAPRR